MSTIYLVCGAPGQGKSTWIKDNFVYGDVYVSRDAIRFYLLDNDDDYFAKEKEVLKLFKYNTELALQNGDNVWVDATFLTPLSRKWVLQLADKYDAKVHAIAFKRPLKTCLKWNEKREGRSYVPRSTIRRMYQQFVMPTVEEGFNNVITIM